jgi:hypothetical protein
MDTVEEHPHSFSPAEWPFADPVNAVAISTRQVFRESYPILRVSDDSDGDWQVLCGTTTELDDAIIVCLGCAYQRDPTIAELANLPLGWTAWRDGPGREWQREPKQEEADEDG